MLLSERCIKNILGYLFGQPNNETLFGALDVFADILTNFIEIPGGMTFEVFGLQAMAALHPPTFVHAQMVAEISVCICSHVIEKEPERIVGALGTENAEDVKFRRKEILSYLRHAALCHDFGKMLIMDTIFVYGRNLLDMEFNISGRIPGWERIFWKLTPPQHPMFRSPWDIIAGTMEARDIRRISDRKIPRRVH